MRDDEGLLLRESLWQCFPFGMGNGNRVFLSHGLWSCIEIIPFNLENNQSLLDVRVPEHRQEPGVTPREQSRLGTMRGAIRRYLNSSPVVFGGILGSSSLNAHLGRSAMVPNWIAKAHCNRRRTPGGDRTPKQ